MLANLSVVVVVVERRRKKRKREWKRGEGEDKELIDNDDRYCQQLERQRRARND